MPKQTAGPAVFMNCPFDSAYRPFFEALVFTIARCGFAPRCAWEIDDAAGTRIEKIMNLIEKCPLAVHDLCRTELDAATGLPRFNMPFELGLFLGARRFGDSDQRQKRCLVLDKADRRYRDFISDIAGQDVQSHDMDVETLISAVRNFLRTNSGDRNIPSGSIIKFELDAFESAKPTICSRLKLDPARLTFTDFSYLVAYYLEDV